MVASNAEQNIKVIVIVEWVLLIISLLFFVGVCVNYSEYIQESLKNPDDAKTINICLGLIVGAYGVGVGINIMLTIGVHQRHTVPCTIWHVLNIISLVLNGIFLGFSVISLFASIVNLCSVAFNVIVFAYRYKCYKVMSEFIQELKGINENSGRVYSMPEQNGKFIV